MHRSTLLLLFASVLSPNVLAGQVTRPTVFFDCAGRHCNSQYYRTEIGWVDWVNDPTVADVHLIMSSTGTGAGGREYQLDFLGRDGLEGYADQMLFRSLPTDTEREELDEIVHVLELGLARYASRAGYRGIVSVEGPDPESSGVGRLVSQAEVDDPWNLWVFRLNGNLNVDGEETQSQRRLNGGLNASRISPTWKIRLNGNVNYRRQEFELSDGVFENTRVDWGFNPLLVYAVATRWSVGLQGQVARMVRFNQDFRVEVTPAVEFSVFPYEEANRRSFTFFYRIGPSYRDYIQRTIDGYLDELRWEQGLEVELSQRQPWGEAGVSLRGSHFLYDSSRYNLSLRGNVDFRVVRGLSVNARGNLGWVEDQIYLSAEGATDQEALLELRQQATDFDYGFSVGLSVQFGSIFNNVVNNRFRGVGFG
jgi:hypothetical protein